MKNNIVSIMDKIIPSPVCELVYKNDYELLIAVMLSARSTDKVVNIVTKDLFNKYNIYDLCNAKKEDIESIIKPVGSYKKKSEFAINIARSLVSNYNGKVPNNRTYLESLNGVGRKTCNVVLAILFNEPAFAVDTHVERVSKRLGLVNELDDVKEIEKKLCNLFPKDKWIRLHLQFVLFGRYYCLSRNPKCDNCLLKEICTYKKLEK